MKKESEPVRADETRDEAVTRLAKQHTKAQLVEIVVGLESMLGKKDATIKALDKTIDQQSAKIERLNTQLDNSLKQRVEGIAHHQSFKEGVQFSMANMPSR